MPRLIYGIKGYTTTIRHSWPPIDNPHRSKEHQQMGDGLSHHALHRDCVARTRILHTQIDELEAKIYELEKKVGNYSHPHPTPIHRGYSSN